MEETNLEKAARLYPVGTIFKSAYSGKTRTVKNDDYHISSDLKEIHVYVVEDDTHYCLLYNSKWAEVVKPVEPKIIENYAIC